MWVLSPLCTCWRYIHIYIHTICVALNMTPNIICCRVGAVPKSKLSMSLARQAGHLNLTWENVRWAPWFHEKCTLRSKVQDLGMFRVKGSVCLGFEV